MDRPTINAFILVGVILSIFGGIAFFADKSHHKNLQDAMDECRNTCVAVPGAKKFMYSIHAGCLCGGELP